jgi:L-2,4-diaminobutyrate decarboxylase
MAAAAPSRRRTYDWKVDHRDLFEPDADGLGWALRLLTNPEARPRGRTPPAELPESGLGAVAALEALAGPVLADARDLAAPGFFAHMDPPTPWPTWAVAMWVASRNQNLLHDDTAPEARRLERLAVGWLAPLFGMGGGHLVPGSTVANLTALWAARKRGASEIVATSGAHLSVAKAADILAMPLREIAAWDDAGDLGEAVAVITAGTTSTGEIEPLGAAPDARWRHVDAAWAGPLVLSERHQGLLAGIQSADSVAVSCHKWLFQPKESAVVLFADAEGAHRSISLGGSYLVDPNIGILGSHGATAAPLLATLIALGRRGMADLIDHTMELAHTLHARVERHPELEARSHPHAGIVVWRHREMDGMEIKRRLPPEVTVSVVEIDGEPWLRSVAANPLADPELVVDAVLSAAECR